MAFFNSRKRQASPPVALVEEIPPTPELPPAQPSQFSSAPLGASLRLVSTAEPGLRLASVAPAAPAGEEPRVDELRGLPLGTILFRQGLVQQEDLEGALVSGMESGERLGEILIRRGLVSLDDIGRGLAAQQGLSFLQPDEVEVDGETVALLSAGEACELGAVPVRPEGETVLVVTADPSAAQREALEARLRRPVTQAVVSKKVFDGLLDDVERPVLPADEHDPAWAEPAEAAIEHHDHIEEEPVDQTWNDAHVEEAAPESWAAPTTAQEMWGELAPEIVHEPQREPEPEFAAEVAVPTVVEAEGTPAWEQHEEPAWTLEEHGPVHEEAAWTPTPQAEWTPEEHHIPFEPAEVEHAEVQHAEVEHAEVSELDAQHDASVGRIGDLLARIEEGASTFNALRAQIGGLTESLRSAEETVSVRERRLEELTGAHEAGERRIEELLGQLHEREEELISVGGKLDDLSGRLVSAEQRLDDREQRLEELFRQVERRDNALSDFETKLNGIAARFAEHVA
jgi:hypothetical protein